MTGAKATRRRRSVPTVIAERDRITRNLKQLVEERATALRAREAELKSQNALLQAALENMSQGLLVFDANERLLINNRRYLEIYGLSPEMVYPGIRVTELLLQRKALGSFEGDPEQYIETVRAALARGDRFGRLVELPDGRTIAVVSSGMADGGWVVTHEDITERRRAERQAAHLAHHDVLTDLPNRLLFQERLAQALRTVSAGQRIAVLYLDIDHFKGVNDTLGHHVGDELLKIVAGRLRGGVGQNGVVARVGGDEFAVIQTGVTDTTEIVLLARSLSDAIRAPYKISDHVITVDASIGISISTDQDTEVRDLLKTADIALYAAKAEGPGNYRFFEPAMDLRLKQRRSLEGALREALVAGQFEMHYQPVVNLKDQSITCCEALIRWRHPERGMISPGEFIPIAEEIGLIVPLGEWVLRQSCADAAKWPDHIKVAVNLSPIQVMNLNLVPVVIGALAAAGLPASRLELEITESVLMQNAETTLTALHRLRKLGVRISMDDFGTGYSSLSYLRSFPFDKIKIDRCFISGLSEGDDSATIVRSIVSLATNLGMTTTAEGVETPEQMQLVRALGCTEMQGFLFSPAQPREHILRLLTEAHESKATSA